MTACRLCATPHSDGIFTVIGGACLRCWSNLFALADSLSLPARCSPSAPATALSANNPAEPLPTAIKL